MNIEISQEEKEISKELGLRYLIQHNDLTNRPYRPAGDQSDEFEAPDEVQSLDEHDEEDLNDIDTYLNQPPAIEEAQRGSTKSAIPSSTHTHKRKALREIARAAIAENPTVNRREVLKDSKNIERATRLFTHVPRMDGAGHWKMDGMRSNLYHHQVCSVTTASWELKLTAQQVQGIGWMVSFCDCPPCRAIC